MKNIGLLAFIGNGHGGGISQYTQSLVDALSIDTRYHYILFTDHDEQRFDHCGLEVRKISRKTSRLYKKMIQLLFIFCGIRKAIFFTQEEKQAFEDIDLFISPIIAPYPHFYINKPFIFTLHDLQERYYPHYFTLKERIIRYILNGVLSQKASHIICESAYVKSDIITFLHQEKEKISVIPAPPPLDFSHVQLNSHTADQLSKKYQLPKKYIFYPAQFWYHKNHIKLLEAFKLVTDQYDDVHLVLTGSKQNNYQQVIATIQALSLESNVLSLGYIDYQDLPYLYHLSEMLVMPTLFESISIPIYEAFLLKVPVCSSDVVALPEQVGDAGLLFDPNNATDMANQIIQLLTHDELKKAVVQKGYEKVSTFSHDDYKDALVRVIQHCL